MRRDADATIARTCLIAALVWAAALPLAAYGASHHAPAAFRGASAVVYAIGAVVCHQRPERSFSSWKVSWPVCARCAGIYLGGAAAALGLVFKRPPAGVRRPVSRVRIAVMAAALPSVATLIYEWSSGIVPGNAVRMLAGLPIGMAVIAAIAVGARSSSAALHEPVR